MGCRAGRQATEVVSVGKPRKLVGSPLLLLSVKGPNWKKERQGEENRQFKSVLRAG